jgi:hypothetical protein
MGTRIDARGGISEPNNKDQQRAIATFLDTLRRTYLPAGMRADKLEAIQDEEIARSLQAMATLQEELHNEQTQEAKTASKAQRAQEIAATQHALDARAKERNKRRVSRLRTAAGAGLAALLAACGFGASVLPTAVRQPGVTPGIGEPSTTPPANDTQVPSAEQTQQAEKIVSTIIDNTAKLKDTQPAVQVNLLPDITEDVVNANWNEATNALNRQTLDLIANSVAPVYAAHLQTEYHTQFTPLVVETVSIDPATNEQLIYAWLALVPENNGPAGASAGTTASNASAQFVGRVQIQFENGQAQTRVANGVDITIPKVVGEPNPVVAANQRIGDWLVTYTADGTILLAENTKTKQQYQFANTQDAAVYVGVTKSDTADTSISVAQVIDALTNVQPAEAAGEPTQVPQNLPELALLNGQYKKIDPKDGYLYFQTSSSGRIDVRYNETSHTYETVTAQLCRDILLGLGYPATNENYSMSIRSSNGQDFPVVRSADGVTDLAYETAPGKWSLSTGEVAAATSSPTVAATATEAPTVVPPTETSTPVVKEIDPSTLPPGSVYCQPEFCYNGAIEVDPNVQKDLIAGILDDLLQSPANRQTLLNAGVSTYDQLKAHNFNLPEIRPPVNFSTRIHDESRPGDPINTLTLDRVELVMIPGDMPNRDQLFLQETNNQWQAIFNDADQVKVAVLPNLGVDGKTRIKIVMSSSSSDASYNNWRGFLPLMSALGKDPQNDLMRVNYYVALARYMIRTNGQSFAQQLDGTTYPSLFDMHVGDGDLPITPILRYSKNTDVGTAATP